MVWLREDYFLNCKLFSFPLSRDVNRQQGCLQAIFRSGWFYVIFYKFNALISIVVYHWNPLNHSAKLLQFFAVVPYGHSLKNDLKTGRSSFVHFMWSRSRKYLEFTKVNRAGILFSCQNFWPLTKSVTTPGAITIQQGSQMLYVVDLYGYWGVFLWTENLMNNSIFYAT